MVVRRAELILTFLVTHEFQGTVGNNLVGVHVHGSTGAALHHIHGELVPQLTVYNFLAGLDDSLGDVLVQRTQFGIGTGRRHLHISHGNDVLRIVVHMRGGNLVIVDGPLGLYTVVSINGNLKFADKVALDPEFGFSHSFVIEL